MSDRAFLSVTIYACPPEHRAAVADLLADADDVEGNTHVWHEEEVGAEQTYAEALAAISDQIAYQVTQDAKYEYDGATVIAVPGMGTFSANVCASGHTIVTREQTTDAIIAAGVNLPAILEAVNALHGLSFLRALAALEAAAEQDAPATA